MSPRSTIAYYDMHLLCWLSRCLAISFLNVWKAGQACQPRRLPGAVQLQYHWATLLACFVQTPCPLKATPAEAQLKGQGFHKAFPDLAIRNYSLWNFKACGLYFSEKFLSYSALRSSYLTKILSPLLNMWSFSLNWSLHWAQGLL